MPDKPEKEERRRRRLEKRRGAIAEPLFANETAGRVSEDTAPDLRQAEMGPLEAPPAGQVPVQEAREPMGSDDIQTQQDNDGAQEDNHSEFPQWERPSLASTLGPESGDPSHISRDDMPPVPPPSSRPRGQRWTGEPVLLALLAVGLVILAVDTYLTLRLNGFSDRLSRMASTTAAAPVANADRPWVGSDKITTVAFANGGQPITTMHIVNSGRAPALDLRSNTVGSLRAASTSAPEIPSQKGPLATTGILFPNMGGNLTFFANTRALTAEEAANVRSGTYVLWLAGRLDYKDPKGHPHVTTFRYRYNPQMNAFVAAPDGNSAN